MRGEALRFTIPAAVLLASLLGTPAAAIDLGGVAVPRERFIVFLALGHSNMCGRVDDIDRETYETHPRVWNYKFDDGTDAWIPAQPPVHRDVSWQRGGGPATPFLKQLADVHPGYYLGIVQNAHSSVTCVDHYRRGKAYYDELVAVAQALSADVTLGGVLVILGAMEANNQAKSQDFANQIRGMMGELRADLGAPDLPLLINRLTRGNTHWQIVQSEIATLPGSLSFADIVPSDGPYKPNDNVHYTWVGQKAWGQAAAQLVDANGWFPTAAGGDPFPPRIASATALDATSVELGFGERLDTASAQTATHYVLMPGVTVSGALLAADQRSVELSTTALTSGTPYVVTVDGVEDLAGNVASGLVAGFDFEHVDIPGAALDLWLRADRGVIADTVSSIPLWADQSDQLNDVIMGRFANHPYLLPAAANGQPAVRFGSSQDQEGDHLNRTRGATYSGDSTLFLVFRVSTTGQPANSSIFSTDPNGGATGSFQLQVDGGDPGVLQLYTDTAHDLWPTTTGYQLLTARIAGTSLELFRDGVAITSHAIGAGEAKDHTLYGIGRNRSGPLYEHLAADVAELLVYHDALTPADRQRVELYLGTKYDLIAAPPGVSVTPSGGLVTTEAGGSDSFTVVLNSAPSASVTIPISSSVTAEASVAPSSLTFTGATWDSPQTVTASGVDDAVIDGNVGYAVVLGAASSADPTYSGFDPPDVSGTNIDDDGVVNFPPVAVISGPSQTSVGIAISFFGGSSTDDGAVVSHDWDFGDGSVDSGQLVSHAWTAAGTFTVTLTVTDDGGQQDQEVLEVTVSAALQPAITLLSPVGGEVWSVGTTQHIRWTTVDLDDIRIDLSLDGGATWQLVDFSDVNDAHWGDYPWVVPADPSTECVIQIAGYNFEVPTTSGLFEIRATAADAGVGDGALPDSAGQDRAASDAMDSDSGAAGADAATTSGEPAPAFGTLPRQSRTSVAESCACDTSARAGFLALAPVLLLSWLCARRRRYFIAQR